MPATSSVLPVYHVILLAVALAWPVSALGSAHLRHLGKEGSHVTPAAAGAASAVETPRLNPSTDQLLLYTYGKVGSSALQYSLARCMNMQGDLPFMPVNRLTYARGIDTHSPFVAEDFLDKVPEGGRAWVIAVTRNPFTHEVSNFFEQIEGIMKGARNVLAAGMPKLSEEFHKHFKRGIQMHNEWFATTLARITQINVAEKARDFDFEKRRLVVEHNRSGRTLVLVVLRYEDIKDWNTILEPLLPNFTMMMANSAAQKASGKKNFEFQENYEWTDEEVKQKLRSDSLPFYTAEEQRSMLAAVKRWGGPQSPSSASGASPTAPSINLNKPPHAPIQVPVTVVKSPFVHS